MLSGARSSSGIALPVLLLTALILVLFSALPAIAQEEPASPLIYIPEYKAEKDALPDRYYWFPFLLISLAFFFWIYGQMRGEGQWQKWDRAALTLLFLAVLAGGALLIQAQEEDDASSTRTRTQKGNCLLEAEFGLRIVPPRPTGQERDLLLTLLNPGIRVDSNGHLLMKVRDVRVAPYPGDITFLFHRGAAGTSEFHRISETVTSDRDLRRIVGPPPVGRPAPRMNAPAGISYDNAPITERLKMSVDYDPHNIPDDCDPIRGELTITWRHNDAPIDFHWDPMVPLQPRHPLPRHRSRVSFGGDIIDERSGIPEETNKATHTTVFFNVDDPFSCCGQANKQFTIIQFVRHRWKLGNGPAQSDSWNLDGPESQSQRHSQGLDYDPTYTTDPAHGVDGADKDNELVHVGPWDASGGSAVIVDDFPGLLEADHRRFMQTGGWFEWEFITLLVCKEGEGSVQHYLDHGKVRAKSRFRIRRTYPGNNQPAVVSGSLLRGRPEGRPRYYDPCSDLKRELDRMGLLDAFSNPRSHRVLIQ